MPKSVNIIGCCGIQSGMDIFEFILSGASAVQVGTQLLREGPICFNRLEKEKGYREINDFKGKL